MVAGEPLAAASDAEFWRDLFQSQPHVLHQLLGDLYRSTRQVGPDRLPTLDDLWDMVAPRFSNEPFGPATHALLGDRSVRWLARQVHMSDMTLGRFLSGERPVVSIRDPRGSMGRLEAVARALGVHPSYYSEWRRLWVLSLIDEAFTDQPNLSIGVYRRFSGHRERRTNQRVLKGGDE